MVPKYSMNGYVKMDRFFRSAMFYNPWTNTVKGNLNTTISKDTIGLDLL